VSRRFCSVLLVVVIVGAGGPPPARAESPPVAYLEPVDAPVVDPFRAPSGPYGAGNRGLEYATVPFAPVHAAASGTVLFAGAVAGTLHVTVLHGDGLRTSYSFLAAVVVGPGATVQQGQVLGLSGERLHVGVRDPDGTYLDPAALFGRPLSVQLVPGGDDGAVADPTSVAGVERRAIADLVALWDGRLGLTGSGDSLLARARLWAHYGFEASPGALRRRLLGRLVTERDLLGTPDCTPAATGPPPPRERRILVLVGGFGTTSESASVDHVDSDALGYAPGDVVRFSYLGGRVPDAEVDTGPLAGLPVTTYTSQDSQQDLVVAGARLRVLLADIAARQPGVPIDVVAHSQGGVVTRIALVGEGTAVLPSEVDTVVTMGSPHDGTDLATGLQAVRTTPGGATALEEVGEVVGIDLDPGSPAARQLAETSDLQVDLARRRLPPDVAVTTIGARGDLTVPAGHTALPGSRHTVVDLTGRSAHSDLPGATVTTREIALAVADLPPTCVSRWNRLTDLVMGETIAWGEDVAGLTAAAAGAEVTVLTAP
jgi:hypothetical protein